MANEIRPMKLSALAQWHDNEAALDAKLFDKPSDKPSGPTFHSVAALTIRNTIELKAATEALRAAQKAYLADRATRGGGYSQELGQAVGRAAEAVDEVLARFADQSTEAL